MGFDPFFLASWRLGGSNLFFAPLRSIERLIADS
jgi:hypothetical protein